MKQSPQIIFDGSAHSLTRFKEQLDGIEQQGVKGITFFIAAGYPHTQDSMRDFLQSMTTTVSGGVFPEVIYKGEYYREAIIAILWFDEMKVKTFSHASDLSSPLYHQKDAIFDNTHDTASLVFSNTKTRAAEAALDALYYRTGQNLQYSGGGAVYALADDKPSIVTNEGLATDAVQVTFFPYQQKSTVGHGWSVLSGPHLVTESEENKIKTLDYQAIKPYYENLIKTNLGEEAKDLSLDQMMRIFPVGIQPYDDTMIIRAALFYEDEQMHFVGDIPEFSSVYILSGKQDSLLSFTQETTEKFRQIAADKPDLSIIISCIGRRQHMDEHSDTELTLLTESLGGKENDNVVGFTSEGEIASNSTGLACLHSMTLVVANIWV